VTRPLVGDASAVVAALVDAGEIGRWAALALGGSIAGPATLPFEVANVLRRHERAGLLSPGDAAQAHADLVALAIEYWPYEPLAPRCWELRANLSTYDAAYVALAEALDTELVTLDLRLARAPGIRCLVRAP
jgi:predicted nucleic acid-binding protein